MKLGASKPWPEAMTMITGEPKMSARALMEYFDPLIKWLEQENKKNSDTLGWPEYDWRPSIGESKTFSLAHRHRDNHLELIGSLEDFKAKCFGSTEELKCTMWPYRDIHSVLLLQPTVKSISLFSALTDEIPLKGRLQIRLMSLFAGEQKREQGHRGDRENVLFSTHI